MKKFKKLLAIMAGSILLATSLVGCTEANDSQTQENTSTETPDIEVSDAIVATIDTVDVKESLFNIYFWSAQQEFESMLGPTIWEMDLDGMDFEELAKEGALNSIVLSVTAQNKANELGIELTEEEKINAANGAKNFVDANIEILQNHKFSQQDIEEFLVSTVTISKLEAQLMDNYMPAEEDIQKFVDENMEDMGTVTAKHVLIKTTDDMNQPLPDDVIAEKTKLAEDVLAKALAGEDMSALAEEYTEDPGSLATGGEYTFGRGQMVAEFEHASFEGTAGEVWPELVETVYGYHIIKTEAHHPAEEADVREIFIQNEKMTFIQNEFHTMIESATVEKTDVYEQLERYNPQPTTQAEDETQVEDEAEAEEVEVKDEAQVEDETTSEE